MSGSEQYDVESVWERGAEPEYEIFHVHRGDGEGSFIYGSGVESQYPEFEMFKNRYIGPILIEMYSIGEGKCPVERRLFISYTRNVERLAALEYLYRNGFIKVLFLGDGRYYFQLTGLGRKIAGMCYEIYRGMVCSVKEVAA